MYVKGKLIKKIDWNRNLYLELDELFFGNGAFNLDEVVEVSSGTNLLAPPSIILDSIKDVGKHGEKINYYSSPLGQDDLREAVMLYESVLSGFNLPNNKKSVITTGAADALRIVFSYLKENGKQRVLTLGPQYSIVYQIITLSGLELIESSGINSSFLPNIDSIKELINTTNCDVLFLTQPNNPSGQIYSESDIKEIIKLAQLNNLVIVYEKLGSDIQINNFNRGNNYGSIITEMNFWDNIILIDSFSKRRSISGIRLGYFIGSKQLEKYANLTRFGDCPPLIGNDGVTKDLLISAVIHLAETKKLNYPEAIQYILRKYNIDSDNIFKFLTSKDIYELIELHRYEIEKMYVTIHYNLANFKKCLSNYILEVSNMDSGSNCLVAFENFPKSEKEMATQLYLEEKIITYPLGCFFIDQSLSKQISNKFWFRLSTAMDSKSFNRIIEKLEKQLNKMSTKIII